MENAKNPYRWAIAFLLWLVPFCSLIPYLAPATFMGQLMQALSIDMAQAGLLITIMLVMSGACMFVGSFVQDALGIKNTFILAMWLLAAGNVVAYLASGYAILLFGRILCGIGYGFCLSCNSPFLSSWFEGKERSVLITVNQVLNSLATAAAYAVAIPLLTAVGGNCNKVFGVFAIVTVAAALLWTFLAKNTPALEAAMLSRKNNPSSKGKMGSLARAVKIKQYWMLMLFITCMVFANSAFTTFLPTLLTETKGLSAGESSVVTSVMSLSGMVGATLGGTLMTKTGRRKPIILVGSLVFAAMFLATTLTSSIGALTVIAVLFCIAYYMMQPVQTTLIIETPDPFDPTILSGAVAMCNGVGMISTMAVSGVFAKLSAGMGMNGAFRMFALLPVLAFVIGLLLVHETGKFRKRKAAAENA